MTIQKLKLDRQIYPRHCRMIFDFQDTYLLQSITDLLETMENMQKEYDLTSPGKGMGVALAADQIEYPYEPVSVDDPTPRSGFYPKDFCPYNLYVVSIRPERALIEKCAPVLPTVYYNANYHKLSSIQHRGHHEWSIKRGTVLISGVEGQNADYFTAKDNSKAEQKSIQNESCASLYGITGLCIPRYAHVEITHLTKDNKLALLIADGFVARVHQHSIDHTHGEEYLKQLNLSSEELDGLLSWVKTNKMLPRDTLPSEIIPGKLICKPASVNFDALGNWARTELSKRLMAKQDHKAADLRFFGSDFNATRMVELSPATIKTAFGATRPSWR
jgi:peptide deformylase